MPDEVLGVVAFSASSPSRSCPYAFVAGLVRTRYSRAGAVGGLIERLNSARLARALRDALADALGDPTLSSSTGASPRATTSATTATGSTCPRRTRGPPAGPSPRSSATASAVGAIVHDAALRDDPSLVRAAAAAAALQLENERLEAELRARVEELQTSRARLVAGLDGRAPPARAQPPRRRPAAARRAVARSSGWRGASSSDDPVVGGRCSTPPRGELDRALEELRELARGIHPAILTDRGLGAALEALAERAPLPVELRREVPDDRLPTAVEAAAYFVVAEALTNVAKYAGAERAHRPRRAVNGDAVGRGQRRRRRRRRPGRRHRPARPADRLAALDGRLEVDSPPGGGTVDPRAKIPCACA